MHYPDFFYQHKSPVIGLFPVTTATQSNVCIDLLSHNFSPLITTVVTWVVFKHNLDVYIVKVWRINERFRNGISMIPKIKP